MTLRVCNYPEQGHAAPIDVRDSGLVVRRHLYLCRCRNLPKPVFWHFAPMILLLSKSRGYFQILGLPTHLFSRLRVSIPVCLCWQVLLLSSFSAVKTLFH